MTITALQAYRDSPHVDASQESAFGRPLEGRACEAYDARAFQYFVALERKRSERSGRPFLLLKVDWQQWPAGNRRLEPKLAGELFSALSPCLRETDFFGWHRQDFVVGAVFTQLTDTTDVSRVIAERIERALRESLPADVAGRFRVFPETGEQRRRLGNAVLP
jgi:hypothetical protein